MDDPRGVSVLDKTEIHDRSDTRTQAWTRFQYVDVVFSATANGNTDILHLLTPDDPEGVDWEVIGLNFAAAPAVVPVIYKDTGPTRRPWGAGYIVLRSNVAALSATLRLFLRPR